jgi:hypothetical protein
MKHCIDRIAAADHELEENNEMHVAVSHNKV